MMMKYTLLLSLLLPINTALFCAHGDAFYLPGKTEIEDFLAQEKDLLNLPEAAEIGALLQETTHKDTAGQKFKPAGLDILKCTEAEKKQFDKRPTGKSKKDWFKFKCQYCPKWVYFQSQNPPVAKTIYNTMYKHDNTCAKQKDKICSICGASFQEDLIFKAHFREHQPQWIKKNGTPYHTFTTKCPDCKETITLRTAKENPCPSEFDKPLKSHAKKCTGKQLEANN